jgi:hypothetical protein
MRLAFWIEWESVTNCLNMKWIPRTSPQNPLLPRSACGKQTSLVSVEPVTDLLGPGFFWVVLSSTADFGTSTITGM